MLETVRKMVLAGLGTLELTEDRLQAVLRDLTARGELTEQEARALGERWMQRLAARREELQREAREAIQRALRGLDVATRRDLEALAARVAALERQAPPVLEEVAESTIDPEC
jgi:polyhydroxyalkanoate synthesis regulator phasin